MSARSSEAVSRGTTRRDSASKPAPAVNRANKSAVSLGRPSRRHAANNIVSSGSNREQPPQIKMWLLKKGDIGVGVLGKDWKRRWFVQAGPHVYYYKKQNDSYAQGRIDLTKLVQVTKNIDRDVSKCIGVEVTSGRVYLLTPQKDPSISNLRVAYESFVAWMTWLSENPDADYEHPITEHKVKKKKNVVQKGIQSVTDFAERYDNSSEEEDSSLSSVEDEKPVRKAQPATRKPSPEKRPAPRDSPFVPAPSRNAEFDRAEREAAAAAGQVEAPKGGKTWAGGKSSKASPSGSAAPLSRASCWVGAPPVEEAERRFKEARLTRATEIDIGMLDIAKTEPIWYAGLPSVTYIDVSFNNFDRWPAGLETMKNLEVLIFGGCKLGLVPSLPQYSSLRELTLSGNNITQIHPRIGAIQTLEKLLLANNQLVRLPETIGWLYRLEELDVSGNPLTGMPSTVGNLKALQLINASSCQLSSVPPEICFLTGLIELNISGNQISQLPPKIGWMSRLAVLSISQNRVIALPASCGLLAGLACSTGTGFDISGNPLADPKLFKERKLGSDRLINYLERQMMMGANPDMSGYPEVAFPKVPMKPLEGASAPAARKRRGTGGIARKGTLVDQGAADEAEKLGQIREVLRALISGVLLPGVRQMAKHIQGCTLSEIHRVAGRVSDMKPFVQSLRRHLPQMMNQKPRLGASDDKLTKARKVLAHQLQLFDTVLTMANSRLDFALRDVLTDFAPNLKELKRIIQSS